MTFFSNGLTGINNSSPASMLDIIGGAGYPLTVRGSSYR